MVELGSRHQTGGQMNRAGCRAQLAILCGLMVLMGCASHHISSKSSRLLDDKVITDRVQTYLRQASSSLFAHVRVKTADGIVTLTGSVPNRSAEVQASRIASGVEEVRKVNLRLRTGS